MNKSKYKHIDNNIIKLYNKGLSAYKIAEILCMKRSTVYYRLYVNNIKTRSISESLVGIPKSVSHRSSLSKSRKEKGMAKGSRNPNWKGGVQDMWDETKNSFEYKAWRKSVFNRDNYTCQTCWSKTKRLQAHHIIPRSLCSLIMLCVWNGITLCKDCHMKLHSNRGLDLRTGELRESPNVKIEGNPQPSPEMGRFNDYAPEAMSQDIV